MHKTSPSIVVATRLTGLALRYEYVSIFTCLLLSVLFKDATDMSHFAFSFSRILKRLQMNHG